MKGDYLPKRSTPNADELALANIGVDQVIYGARRFFCEGMECFDDEAIFKGQPFTKAHAEGRLNICFFLRIGQVPGDKIGAEHENGFIFRARISNCSILPDQSNLRNFADDCINSVNAKLGNIASNHQQSVFVTGVKGIEAPQLFVPVTVRLEVVNRFHDLFTGELYLSLLNGSFKSILFPYKRELNIAQSDVSTIFHHAENGKVQSRPQVMNSISNNEREAWRNGLIGFGPEYYLSSLALELDDELKGVLRQEGIDLPAKIIDVMAGPL